MVYNICVEGADLSELHVTILETYIYIYDHVIPHYSICIKN